MTLQQDRSWTVYALVDPRNAEVRYVGWTVNLRVRLRDHCKPSRLAHGTRRDNWIRLLADAGLAPGVVELEHGIGPGWPEREAHWIQHYRVAGADLTNHTDGGEGTPGRKHTPEAKAQMSAKRKGRKPSAAAIEATRARTLGVAKSPEWRAKVSAANRGKPKSEEHKRAISLALKGRKATDEARRNQAEAQRGKKRGPMSEAQKRKLSEAKKGKPNEAKRAWWATLTPEQRSEIVRKRWKKNKCAAS